MGDGPSIGLIPINDVSRRCLGSAAASDIAFRLRIVARMSLVGAVDLVCTPVGLASSCTPSSGAVDEGFDDMLGEDGLESEL